MYDTDTDFIPKINATYNIFLLYHIFVNKYFLFELKILKKY